MPNHTTKANRGSTASGFPDPGIDRGDSEQWRQREFVVDTARPQVGQASNDIAEMRTGRPRCRQKVASFTNDYALRGVDSLFVRVTNTSDVQ
jgi:hypothetical protein